MKARKQIPTWYRVFIEKKIKNLETALSLLNKADIALELGLVYTAKSYLKAAKNS
jgi:hypothetical protein